MTENRGPDRPPDKANEKDAERLQHTHQRVGLREKERAKNQRTYRAVKQKVIPLDRGSDRARYQGTAQLSAMFVLGHGCDGLCGDYHLSPPRWCCGFAPPSRTFRILPVRLGRFFTALRCRSKEIRSHQLNQKMGPLRRAQKSAASGAAPSRSE